MEYRYQNHFLISQITLPYVAVTNDPEILMVTTTKIYFVLTLNFHHRLALIPLDAVITPLRQTEQLLVGSLTACDKRKQDMVDMNWL